MHRFDPVGALDTSRAKVWGSPLTLTRRTDGFWPEDTLDRRTKKAKSGSLRGCLAMTAQVRRAMRILDRKAAFLVLTIRQRQVLPSCAWVPQEDLTGGGQSGAWCLLQLLRLPIEKWNSCGALKIRTTCTLSLAETDLPPGLIFADAIEKIKPSCPPLDNQ